MHLELHNDLAIDLATSEVVGDGILMVCDVGNPIVAVDIGDAEDVETVNAEPYTGMLQRRVAVGLADSKEAEADVCTLVGRSTELLVLQTAVGRTEGQTVGKGEFEGHLPAFGTGEVVGEMQIDAPALVGRHGYADAVDSLLSGHQTECEPRVCAWHEFAEELEIETEGVAVGDVLTVVDNLHVLHVIGNQVIHELVVGLGRETEGTVGHSELIVEGTDDMQRTLALDVVVQRDDGLSVAGRSVAQLLVERCLVVESSSQSERHVLITGGNDGQRDSRRHDGFLVEAPVGHAYAVVQRP